MSAIKVTSDARNRRVFANIGDIRDETEKSIRRAWFELGKDLKSEANREILRKPKSGRTYFIRTRAGRVRRHVASAPGETHANLTGWLRRSISWKVSGTDEMRFGYGISTTARNANPEYDAFVERGTRRMAARPSLSNAIDATQRSVPRDFVAEMNRRFKS